MKKFIIDTSVLLYHEDSIHAFPDNHLIIPMEVLEEIDSKKTRNDRIGNAARYVNRFLDDLRKIGSLSEGVKLDNGQVISVYLNGKKDLEDFGEGLSDLVDNRIISIAKSLNEKYKNDVVLISRDIGMRVKCDAIGVESENYTKEKAIINRRGAYTGVSVIHVNSFEIDEFYEKGCIALKDEISLMPNEFVVLKSSERQSAVGIHRAQNKIEKRKKAEKMEKH